MNTTPSNPNLAAGFRRLIRSLLLPLLAAAAWQAQAQPTTVCGPEVKEEVAKLLLARRGLSEDRQLALQAEVYAKYQACAEDGKNVPENDPFFVAARQCGARVAYVGSLYYEEMPCCGYDPQRRAFTCPVKVKQTFGFGAAPNPGSREYTLHCVATPGGGWVPVGLDSVHLANAIANSSPPWQFGVLTHANRNLQQVQPMNAQTREVRSILSWNLQPTGCDYQPIWGNVIQYRIRLDQ